MVKIGMLEYDNGIEYKVYEIERPSFTRIDILVKEAEFHTDIENYPEAAYFKRRNMEYYLGNRELLNSLDSTKARALAVRAPIKQSKATWITDPETNKRYLEHTISKEGSNASYSIVYRNNIEHMAIYRAGSIMYATYTMPDSPLDMDLVPITIDEYDKVKIERTEQTSNSTKNVIFKPYSTITREVDLSWQKNYDFEVLEDVREVDKYLASLKTGDITGFDYETNSLDFNYNVEGSLVAGIVVGKDENTSRYLPFNHKSDIKNLPLEYMAEVYSALRKQTLVAHNKKFEYRVLMYEGVDLEIHHDTLVMSYLMVPDPRDGGHALDDLAQSLDGNKRLNLNYIFNGRKNIYFPSLTKDICRIYACPDGSDVIKVYNHFYRDKNLPLEKLPLYHIENELVKIKAQQEYYGFRVDSNIILAETAKVRGAIIKLENFIKDYTKSNINLKSPQQIADMLYNKIGAPIKARTGKGAPSTGIKALRALNNMTSEAAVNPLTEDLLDDFEDVIIKKSSLERRLYPFVGLLMTHRALTKLYDSYYSKFKIKVDEAKGDTCRLTFWVNQFGAASGRQSSPFHQLPGSVKTSMLSDSSHHSMVAADFNAIELRVVFSLAKEREFVELTKNRDNDIHRVINKIIYKKDIWEITNNERHFGKRRNFGVVYLISGRGLAEQAYGSAPTEEQIKIAQDSINEVFENFPRLANYLKTNELIISREGKIKTLFGRHRDFKRVLDPDTPASIKKADIRSGNNMPVQGTAADIMKIAEVSIQRHIKEKGWDKLEETPEGMLPLVRIIISVHDEVVISYNTHKVSYIEVMHMLRECMEMQIEGLAPLFADTVIIDNWAQGGEDTQTIPYELYQSLWSKFEKGELTHEEIYPKDPPKAVHEIVTTFLDNQIHNYLNGIIAEVGRDVKEISVRVTHPKITHQFISRYENAEFSDNQSGAIEYAVTEYLKGSAVTKDSAREEINVYEESLDILEALSDSSVTYNMLDDKGMEVDTNTGEYSAYVAEDEEILEDNVERDGNVLDLIMNEKIVVKLLDSYFINVNGLTIEQMKDLNVRLKEYSNKEGYYQIIIKLPDRLLPLKGVSFDELPSDKIEKLISDYKLKGKEV